MKIGELILKPYDDEYILMADFKYQINDFIITVPKGFVTDLASVPRLLWGILPPNGLYTEGAIVHDYLYSYQNTTGINKTLADKIFLFIMKECGVSKIVRNMMYRAVQTFGGVAWIKQKINGDIPYIDKALVDHTTEAKEYYDKMYKLIGDIEC